MNPDLWDLTPELLRHSVAVIGSLLEPGWNYKTDQYLLDPKAYREGLSCPKARTLPKEVRLSINV
jgi:hypothetical protein